MASGGSPPSSHATPSPPPALQLVRACAGTLQDVTLDVRRGEILGIAGARASGKTALLRAMNGLDPLERGRVLVEGRDLAALPRHELQLLRQRIGYVAPRPHLLHNLTIAENVALPLQVHGRLNAPRRAGRVRECLAALGLEAVANAYPGALAPDVHARAAVARALAPLPDILLCDDPTADLDPVAGAAVLTALANLGATIGSAIVVASRDTAVLGTLCARVAVLEGGSLAELVDLGGPPPRAPRTALGREVACHRIESRALIGAGALHA